MAAPVTTATLPDVKTGDAIFGSCFAKRHPIIAAGGSFRPLKIACFLFDLSLGALEDTGFPPWEI